MANKTKHRPQANDRKRKSFESRYGMTRSDFRKLEGVEKARKQQIAYHQFIQGTKLVVLQEKR